MSVNRVVLVGRLTRDPELKYTKDGIAVASMGIACDRNVAAGPDGNKPCDFFDVTAWRQSAEFAANYLVKGQRVAVDGRLQQDRWQDKDGNNRSKVQVVADRIEGLDKPKGAEGAPEGATAKLEDEDPFAAQ